MNTPSNKIRIILADDHPIVRDGIKFQLKRDNIDVIGEAINGLQAVDLCHLHRPDLIIMDISMPKQNGIESAEKIKEISPETRIILLSMHQNPEYLAKAIEIPVNAYILKDDPIEDWTQMVDQILAGKRYISPVIEQIHMQYLTNGTQQQSVLSVLTKREKEILNLIVKGFSSKMIANELFLSVRTVQTHRQNMMRKLDVHDVASLVRLTLENTKEFLL